MTLIRDAGRAAPDLSCVATFDECAEDRAIKVKQTVILLFFERKIYFIYQNHLLRWIHHDRRDSYGHELSSQALERQRPI